MKHYMSILAVDTQIPTDISFNSGTFNVNGVQLAVLQDITISLNWSTKEIRQLGSIIMAVAPKRSTFKPGAKAKVKSVNQELFSFFMGSSGPDGSGFAYNVFDGQNLLTRASVRCFVNEDPTQVVE